MRILHTNIALLIAILICHYAIIKSGGRNNIFFDVTLIISLVSLVYLNIFGIYRLFKRISVPVIISLMISLCYYLLLFAFPLFEGTG